jgi:hypothetical protein
MQRIRLKFTLRRWRDRILISWPSSPVVFYTDVRPIMTLLGSFYASEYAAIATVGIGVVGCLVVIIADPLIIGLRIVLEKLSHDANDPRTPLTNPLSLADSQQYERLRTATGAIGIDTWDWDVDSGSIAAEGFPSSLQDWLASIHPADLADFQAAMKRHLLGEDSYFEAEYRLVGSSTNSSFDRWIQTRGRIVARCGRGTPTRMVGTHQVLVRAASRSLRIAA